jgi:hypothetical protein
MLKVSEGLGGCLLSRSLHVVADLHAPFVGLFF